MCADISTDIKIVFLSKGQNGTELDSCYKSLSRFVDAAAEGLMMYREETNFSFYLGNLRKKLID